METSTLRQWAKFQKLSYAEKRKMFSKLVSDDCKINCEWKTFRILVRLTFSRYNDLHKIPHPEDRLVKKFINELELSPSTVVNWYYTTKKEFQHNSDTCDNCRFNAMCEGNKDSNYNQIRDKYGYDLISKRLYQILTKTEKFKGLMNESLSDAEIRLALRRLVDQDYYHRKKTCSKEELICREASEKMKIKPITALKWFYAIKDSK
ncbi:MAG: hypothetical protein Q8O89_03605, partial [Nanoarchaeota archaeon]|nr:hypothetical protein [Nanoarchaeota archaeon]